MTVHIAVDIGGTQLRAAAYVPHSLNPLKLSRISTQSPYGTPVDRLKELIASIWPDGEEVAAIGVAAPGPTDPYQGILLSAPNIPGWVNLPLASILEDQFQVPVALGNDANLAALGEWRFGAGQDHHNLVYLTVSTGIGGGVIINDQLLLGHRGLAAELGHITIMHGGPLCSCGQRGHLEAVASGTAISRWVQDEIAKGANSSLPADVPLSGKQISAAARDGDELARAALYQAGTYLGVAIADFLHIFNPSIVIIGGGVSQSADLIIEPINAALRSHVMTPEFLQDLKLTTAALGDEAGLMGALALARSIRPA